VLRHMEITRRVARQTANAGVVAYPRCHEMRVNPETGRIEGSGKIRPATPVASPVMLQAVVTDTDNDSRNSLEPRDCTSLNRPTG